MDLFGRYGSRSAIQPGAIPSPERSGRQAVPRPRGTLTPPLSPTSLKGTTMTLQKTCLLAATVLWVAGGPRSLAQEKRFLDLVGPGPVGPVTQTSPLQVPYITWGGDMATFYANGGLSTKADTLFQKQGLSLKLTAGDDFVQQVRDYRAGKTPFLRGTFHMIGLASDVIGADPRTKGVVILQMTWSAGDHMVARQPIRTVADLKGKTVALQQGGPHVGMLDDVLRTAKLTWDDIKVVWAKDLTGSPDSPPPGMSPAISRAAVLSRRAPLRRSAREMAGLMP